MGRLLPALLIPAVLTAALAQEPTGTDEEPVNFVFATQLGSGIYASGDQTVQVYRIPGTWTLFEPAERPWGIALRFSGCLGFYDFRLGDLLEGEIPDNVDTLTLMVGAESEVVVKPNWSIVPYADVGYGRAVDLGTDSWIYDIGLESRARFPRDRLTYLLDNRLVWAGQSEATAALADDFLQFETVFDVRVRLRWSPSGRPTDLGFFLGNTLYFDSIAYLRFPRSLDLESSAATEGQGTVAQYEVGVTIGTVERSKIWKIPLPRFGLSYRFGDDLSVVRVVFGGPF